MLYCYDCPTGEIPVCDITQWQSVHGVSTADVKEISQAFQAVRTAGNGDGEVTILLLGGWFDRIKTSFTRHREKKKKSR